MPDFFGEYAGVVGLMAPCGVINKMYTAPLFTPEMIQFFTDNKIYALNGPRWEDAMKEMCDHDETLCGIANEFNGRETISIKTMYHYAQNSINDRFQVYIDDYFNAESTKSRLMDYGMIKNPVSMWIGLWDDTCPPEHAFYIKSQLGKKSNHFKAIPWNGHCSFAISDRPAYVNDIIAHLDIPE